MTTMELPQKPGDAETAWDWEDDDGTPYRFFYGPTKTVQAPARYERGHLFTTPVEVEIWTQGNQWADGHVRREVCVAGLHDGESLSLADARRVADAWNAAVAQAEAAELDRLGS